MQWNKDTLKAARQKARLSQASLADELGVHFSDSTKLGERDYSNPDICSTCTR